MEITKLIKYREGQEFVDHDNYKLKRVDDEGRKEYACGYKRIIVDEIDGKDIVYRTTLTTKFESVKT